MWFEGGEAGFTGVAECSDDAVSGSGALWFYAYGCESGWSDGSACALLGELFVR